MSIRLRKKLIAVQNLSSNLRKNPFDIFKILWIGSLTLGRGLMALRLLIQGRVYRRFSSVIRDIPFGEHPRHKLDFFPAPKGTSGPVPLVVFIPGGAYERFGKNDHALIGKAFQGRGCAVAVINTRLYPEVTYPRFIEDAAAAVSWLKRNAASYGADPDRMALLGHSSGGITASLLVMDGRRYGLPADCVRAAISVSALYSYEGLERTKPDWVLKMGGMENFNGPAQPLSLAGKGLSAPLLILHGGRDQIAPFESARRFYQLLSSFQAPVELAALPDLDHYSVLFRLTSAHSGVTVQTGEFIRKNLL